MNEKVKEFLEAKREEERKSAEILAEKEEKLAAEKKRCILLSLGLFEKVFDPEERGIATNEYPYYEYDEKSDKNRYFKKVAFEVSDEEFEEIKKYAPQVAPSPSFFSNKKGKEIPDSLEECYAPDEVSAALKKWSDLIIKIGPWIVGILISIGIFSTISSGIEMSYIDEDFVFSTVISSIFSWALYIIIAIASYTVVSLLVAALSMIVENTKIAAKVALYKAAKEETKE